MMSKMAQFKGRFVEKVVLVAPPMKPEQVWGELADWADNYPPLGLCYIGAYLRENGYDVTIIDAEALRYSIAQTVECIGDQKPDIVGFNCKTLWVNNAHRVAQALKDRLPDVPIVAGGHHPTALPERTLKEFPCFDILVLGEGEVTFYELLQALNNDKDITQVNGLAFKADGTPYFTPPRERIKNLDELPMPAFDLIPSLETHYPASLIYAIKEASFPLMTSRGCPSQCTFCDRSVFRNRVTFHSPEYVMAMIEHLHHNHNIRYFIIDDDNFFLKKTHMYALLDMLKSSGLSIKFTCQGRVDTIDEEKLQRLKESGCKRVMFGIESGSQLILDNMKKDITVEQAKKAIDMTKKAGLLTMGLFILGFPGETEETLKETTDFIYECKLDDIICAFYLPLPGSEAYQDIEKHGTYHEDFENSNSTEPQVFVPQGTTVEMLKFYHAKCQNACYARTYQFRSFSRRVPTQKHLKAFKSFFTQK
jgi:anaerobic magnesium-protoporphyrin IX monomethyl ester cyclase